MKLLSVRCRILIALPFATLAGCGARGPALTPVSGVVTQGGKPLAGAFVRFVPQGDTLGHGGIAKTDAAGRYEVLASRQNNRKGLVPGEYKAVVSRMRMPDGSPPPPKAPPIDSGARESIPATFAQLDQTPLAVVVGVEPKTFDIAVDEPK